MKFSQLKCFDLKSKCVFDVLEFSSVIGQVTVRGMAINGLVQYSDPKYVPYTLKFNQIEMISFTGKLDQAERGIFEGDKISYGVDLFSKSEPTGLVYWDIRQLAWMIQPDDGSMPIRLGEIQSEFIKVIGSKYGGYYSGR